MDDKERQSAHQNVQGAREKGADVEYDAQDENALETSAPASDQNRSPHREEK